MFVLQTVSTVIHKVSGNGTLYNYTCYTAQTTDSNHIIIIGGVGGALTVILIIILIILCFILYLKRYMTYTFSTLLRYLKRLRVHFSCATEDKMYHEENLKN